jgi:hypothetical protein
MGSRFSRDGGWFGTMRGRSRTVAVSRRQAPSTALCSRSRARILSSTAGSRGGNLGARLGGTDGGTRA